MTPHQRATIDLIAAVRRRGRVRDAMNLAAIALPWATLCLAWWRLADPWFAVALAVASTAAAVAIRKRRDGDRVRSIPLLIDRRMRLDNVLVTAVELQEGRLRTSPMFHQRVIADAEAQASRIAAGQVVPLGSAARALAASGLASFVLLALVLVTSEGRRAEPAASTRFAAPAAAGTAVRVRLSPPSYLAAPVRELTNPERLDVISGTGVEAGAADAVLRWVAADNAGAVAGAGRVRFMPRVTGVLSIERSGAIERVIPVAVAPDEVPKVSIATPKGDLSLDAAAPVRVTARVVDDHALTATELRFTRVSGSGEQFEFADGVLPLQVERAAAGDWRVAGELPLARMGAARGDTIVFRVAARDGRGAGGEGLSDAVVIEIAAPGGALTAGAAIDPTEDKFALSQQMILMKLRRLHASRRTLIRADLLDQSRSLAAQQRSVRALVVFMLGGEVEDEEVEAAHSHEIQEGRLEDTSRQDLVRAINLMSRVEQHLSAAATAPAIPPAEAAVEAVQRAFGRRRYFLRTTPVRMRIDPSRRLTGETSAASSLTVPENSRPTSGAILQAMESLAQVAADAGKTTARERLVAAAATVLAVDPRRQELQALAASLQHAEVSSAERVRALAERGLSLLAGIERTQRPGELHRDADAGALRTAWADQWRAGARP